MPATPGDDDLVPIAEMNLRAAGHSTDALAAEIVRLLREGSMRLVDLSRGIPESTVIRVMGLTGDTDGHRDERAEDA